MLVLLLPLHLFYLLLFHLPSFLRLVKPLSFPSWLLHLFVLELIHNSLCHHILQFFHTHILNSSTEMLTCLFSAHIVYEHFFLSLSFDVFCHSTAQPPSSRLLVFALPFLHRNVCSSTFSSGCFNSLIITNLLCSPANNILICYVESFGVCFFSLCASASCCFWVFR